MSTKIDIQLDARGLAETLGNLVRELDVTLEQAMTFGLDAVAAEARTSAPTSPGSASDGGVVDASGALRRSISAAPVTGTFSGGGLIGVVSAYVPYALHVEYGTKAHVITPKAVRNQFGPNFSGYNIQATPRAKRRLRWAAGGGAGGWAYAKQVNHPGTAAQPFLRPALARNQAAIEDKFQKATRLAILRAKAGA